jgi:hypothetical protein
MIQSSRRRLPGARSVADNLLTYRLPLNKVIDMLSGTFPARSRRLLPALVLLIGCFPAQAFEITPKGHELARFFDGLDVERHWLAGTHVNWRTGDRDSDRHASTHCSAFVASACERLGVYILRPPEHPQVLLANAQFEWLRTDGKQRGWHAVKSPLEAQRLANEGHLVVAAYRNPDPKKSGHVAFVRPSAKRERLIESEGPQVIQAGASNYTSTSLKNGFRHHPDAWIDASHHAVRFYVQRGVDVSAARAPSRPYSATR